MFEPTLAHQSKYLPTFVLWNFKRLNCPSHLLWTNQWDVLIELAWLEICSIENSLQFHCLVTFHPKQHPNLRDAATPAGSWLIALKAAIIFLNPSIHLSYWFHVVACGNGLPCLLQLKLIRLEIRCQPQTTTEWSSLKWMCRFPKWCCYGFFLVCLGVMFLAFHSTSITVNPTEL